MILLNDTTMELPWYEHPTDMPRTGWLAGEGIWMIINSKAVNQICAPSCLSRERETALSFQHSGDNNKFVRCTFNIYTTIGLIYGRQIVRDRIRWYEYALASWPDENLSMRCVLLRAHILSGKNSNCKIWKSCFRVWRSEESVLMVDSQ